MRRKRITQNQDHEMKTDTKNEQTEKLTTKEQAELEKCEAIIENGIDTFFDVAAALDMIREARLYRFRYTAFSDYCEDRWGFKRRRADRMIEAAKVLKTLEGEYKSEAHGTQIQVKNLNERQVRELVKVPPDKRMETLKKVAALGPVTAKSISTFAKAERPADYSAYTSPSSQHQATLPMPVPIRPELETAINELVMRRHKVWATNFIQFPATITREIMQVINASK